MAEDREPVQHVLVDRVAWSNLIQFPKTVRACALALQPNRVIMGTVLVAVLMFTGSLYDGALAFFAFSGEAPATPFGDSARYLVDQAHFALRELVGLRVFAAMATVVATPFQLLAFLWESNRVFLFVYGLWFLIVWGAGAGTICRSAACDYALRQQIPWTEALGFALRRWVTMIGPFVLPLAFVLGAIVLLGLGGMLLRAPVLDVIASIFMGLALVGGVIAVCILALTAFGSVLFIPAVAVESADTPDALARGFSYVKNRPLHFLLYGAIAIFFGLTTYAVLAFLFAWAINFTAWGAGAVLSTELAEFAGGAGMDAIRAPEIPDSLGLGTGAVAAAIIAFWRAVVGALLAGFVVSYIASAQTVVYFLMRKATDDQDDDEIWLEGMIPGACAPDAVANQQTGAVSESTAAE